MADMGAREVEYANLQTWKRTDRDSRVYWIVQIFAREAGLESDSKFIKIIQHAIYWSYKICKYNGHT